MPKFSASAAAYAAAVLTVLLWGAAFPAIHIALAEMPAASLGALRFAIAGVVLGGWLAWRRPELPRGRDLIRFAVCGLVGIAVYNLLLNTGQKTVSAGAASFIINTQPVIAAVFAGLLLKERVGAWAWAGMAVSLIGVGLIAAGQPGGLRLGAGASLVLAAACCSGLYFVLQKPLAARYGPMTSAAFSILAGAAWLSPWLPQGLAHAAVMSARGWGAVLFLALGAGVVGYAAWMKALAGLGAARATRFLFGSAPVALGLSLLLTGEAPSLVMIVGGVLALAGVALAGQSRPTAPVAKVSHAA